MEPRDSMPYTQGLSNLSQSSSEAMSDVSEQRWFLQCEVVSLTPNLQAGGPLLVGWPRLLIQHICS